MLKFTVKDGYRVDNRTRARELMSDRDAINYEILITLQAINEKLNILIPDNEASASITTEELEQFIAKAEPHHEQIEQDLKPEPTIERGSPRATQASEETSDDAPSEAELKPQAEAKEISIPPETKPTAAPTTPTKGETLGVEYAASPAAFPPINLNSATVEELMGIDGVGKVIADRIIENRPYENIAHAKSVVKGFDWDKNADLIEV